MAPLDPPVSRSLDIRSVGLNVCEIHCSTFVYLFSFFDGKGRAVNAISEEGLNID